MVDMQKGAKDVELINTEDTIFHATFTSIKGHSSFYLTKFIYLQPKPLLPDTCTKYSITCVKRPIIDKTKIWMTNGS